MPRACSLLALLVLLSACGATTSRTADDPSTTTRVKIALLNDAQLGGLRLDVKTFQGVVTLSGTVTSDVQARQAIAVARRVQDVKDVKSELNVVSRSPGPIPLADNDDPVTNLQS
jgi:hypothetical protein